MGKCNRNIPLYTYPAVAGYLQKGECSDEKSEENLLLATYSAVAGYLSEGECGDGKGEEMTSDE